LVAPAVPEPLLLDESLLLAGGVADGVLLEELLGAELLPPEAEPELDLDGSVAELLPLAGALDEDELEPELEGGVDEGVELLLELPLVPPLLGDLVVPLSWPQAARPKAMATATARVESFMCPPWLGYRKKAAKNGPGLNP
jgi:hypothetical protein